MTQKLTRRGPEFYRYLWQLSLPMILQNLITFSLGLIDTSVGWEIPKWRP